MSDQFDGKKHSDKMRAELEETNAKAAEIRHSMRQYPLTRRFINLVYKTTAYSWLFLTPEGWKTMSDKESRDFLFTKEGGVGMLENSIVQSTLYIPSNASSLEALSPDAGRWASYDFRRKAEFGPKVNDRDVGRLMAFPLDEIILNMADDYTPTGLLRSMDFEHISTVVLPSHPDELIMAGMMKECSYEEAFRKAGVLEQYKTPLGVLDLLDKPVYQVTPKGNGLIFLSKEGGDTAPKKLWQEKLAYEKYS